MLSVSKTVISQLHKENTVAIHFPGNGADDLRSVNPDDYPNRADRHAIKLFVELARQGGYIWTQYYTESTAKVGYIRPSTNIVFRTEKWENTSDPMRLGRPAILKTLQMFKVRSFTPDKMLSLRACRPRQGTISRWPSAHGVLQAVVDGTKVDLKWEHLSPSQQEVAFAEFLREHDIAEMPKLEMLLMPLGRTLKDVDLYGVAKDGKKIFAQVTFSQVGSAQGKLDRLRQFAGTGNHLLFLGQTEKISRDGDVWVIPTSILDHWLQYRSSVTSHFMDDINEEQTSNQASEAIAPQGGAQPQR